MTSSDPDFKTKTADIVGLCLDPRCQAAVFRVGEKTAIHAPNARERVFPLSPARAEGRTSEHSRDGALSLHAALSTRSGSLRGSTARHTSGDLVAFLGEVVATCEPHQQLHLILDKRSAQRTKTLARLLDQHPDAPWWLKCLCILHFYHTEALVSLPGSGPWCMIRASS